MIVFKKKYCLSITNVTDNHNNKGHTDHSEEAAIQPSAWETGWNKGQ